MKKIVECIPNFSEGRDQEKLDQILAAIESVKGVFMLDSESDADHNRSVVSFAGSPEAVMEGAFQGIKKAAELINLNQQKGEHPRMGATDVCPLVPIKGVKMSDCVKYAEQLGSRVGKELKIPVYLYEEAAKKPERVNLAEIRKGEYETIKKEIGKVASRKPDFGPAKLGPAGATAIGAREALVAYNVNLATNDLKIAKEIAKTVRWKTGGFSYVKALGFALEDRGIVQVSMNLTNYKKSQVHHVFEAISREAERYGVQVLESEVVGLIPEKALNMASKYYLKINDFKNKQILERILEKKMAKSRVEVKDFLNSVTSKKPVPGGGSVSALAGSLAGALSSMVANLTLAGKKYSKVHGDMEKLSKKADKLREELYELIDRDAEAYQDVVKAYRSDNAKNIQEALKGAAMTPMEIAEKASKILDILKALVEKGNPNAISDCGVGLYMVQGAVKGAKLNVLINLKDIEDQKFNKEMREKLQKIEKAMEKKSEQIEGRVLNMM